MLTQPNTQQRAAIESLSRHTGWPLLVDWLTENHQRAMDQCARADDDVHLRRAQGEAQCLSALLRTLLPRS
ncbi:hypothetical protein KEH57_04255 [Burkholderia cenocepacia]|uniref:hypothetical protein n=1 Tax=Burkholderia cenocepacia TaxID=95486 RepID=UPI001BABB8A3|nr:hypothetical protein [Burkholderia cenocepacia]QUO26148.1 hypothetical protein KEH57_04255 [Burkholderia cenocepacia]